MQSNIHKNKAELKNTVGIVYAKKIKIFREGGSLKIELKSVIKVILSKRRSYKKNFAISIMVSITLFKLASIYLPNCDNLLILLPILLFVTICMLFKDYDYTLLILEHNDFVKLKIKKEKFNDAENICQLINEKLNKK